MTSNQDMSSFINQARNSGMGDDEIRQSLVESGWDVNSVNEALKPPVPSSAPIISSTQTIPEQNDPTPASNTSPTLPQIDIKQINSLQSAMNTGSASKGLWKKILIVAVVLFLIGGAGAGAYFAYEKGMFSFSKSPYSEENFISGLLSASSVINSSTYKVTGSFSVENREADARPFEVKLPDDTVLKELYSNDGKRIDNIEAILQSLQSYKGYGSKQNPYPESLSKLSQSATKFSLTDPVTKIPYQYSVSSNGDNFSLSAIFETQSAVREIKRGYGFSASTTLINGQKVTFTKDSPQYFFFDSKPPEPLFVVLADSLRGLPPDVSFNLSFGGSANWSELANWKFIFDGSGDFGDLSYKVNVESIKKDKDLYFKVNNIPSLFLGSISSYKGQWIKVDLENISSVKDSYDEMAYFASALPEIEKKYKESKKEISDAVVRIAEAADSSKVFKFASEPAKEKLDGRSLYRMELKLNKSSIVPFYKKVIEESSKFRESNSIPTFEDEGLLNYLQSSEFDEVFDYFSKNTKFTIWVDGEGYLAKALYEVRIVPPDTAAQLKNKQIMMRFVAEISDINSVSGIEAPQESRPLQEILDENKKNLDTVF